MISADTSLHLADFRSAERTFDLLTQVAGRAGREKIRGKVYIQTYVPEHYAILESKNHDYHNFYKKELVFRKELGWPPFRHIIKIIFGGREEPVVMKRALEFKKLTGESCIKRSIDILGPAPCLISKRRGYFLWNMYYRGDEVLGMNILLKEAMKTFNRQGVYLTIDVDPR